MELERISCPRCGAWVSAADRAPGTEVACGCGERVVVPAPPERTVEGVSCQPTPPVVSTPARLPFSAAFLTQYAFVRLLGEGAMGTVYLMKQRSLDRFVAVKIIKGEAIARVQVSRFQKEARVLAEVNHPNVVGIHDVGTDGDVPYMVCEFVEGDTLAHRMRREPPLTLGQTLVLTLQILDGLSCAHQQGIVHRDLKPENILLTRSGRPKIADFGLARSEALASGASIGAVMGTPPYMSPEVCHGESATPASDIYAMGVILFEMATGRLPFTGPSFADFVAQHTRDPAPDPRSLSPDLPAALSDIVAHALEKDPKSRFGSTEPFAQEILQLYRNLTSPEAAAAAATSTGQAGSSAASARVLDDSETSAVLAAVGAQTTERKAGALPARTTEPIARVPDGQRPAASAVEPVRRAEPPRAARIHPVAVLAAVALLGVAAVWLWQERVGLREEYYGSIVMRRGVPEGLWRVSASEARHRFTTFKLYRRGGEVEAMDIVNGEGLLTRRASMATFLSDSAQAGRECRYEFERDRQGQLKEVIARDLAQEVLWRLECDTAQTAHYVNKLGFPQARSGSGAAYLGFVWTPEGYQQEVHFLDPAGKPRADDHGSFGEREVVDARGLPIEEDNLGFDGQPLVRKDGRGKVKHSYDERGLVSAVVSCELRGRPNVGADGYSRVRYAYDAHGNCIEEAYEDLDGQLTFARSGSARVTAAYDDQGNPIEIAWWGTDGRLTLGKNGYARLTSTFDARGNCVDQTFFDTDGTPTPCKQGYARVTAEHDVRGNVIDSRFFGTDGKPTLCNDGYARVTFAFDARGDLAQQAYFGLDGRPVVPKAGYARTTLTHDESGSVVREDYFGVDGRPALQGDGYATATLAHDARGNVTEVAYLGDDGKPTLQKGGFARLARTYDAQGSVVEERCLDLDGNPVLCASGYATCRFVYDERGDKIEQAYLGLHGEPIAHKDGHARLTWKVNGHGRIVEMSWFGADGKPFLTPAGFACVRSGYDEPGRCTTLEYFGADGKPCLHKDGYTRLFRAFDERGDIVEEAYHGLDGAPTRCTAGYARSASVYDRRGNLVEVSFLGTDGKPVPGKDGYSTLRMTVDARDRVTSMAYFGTDGKPVAGLEGYARLATTWNDRGDQTSESFFGVDGRPMPCLAGFARIEATYDARGNVTQQAFFGPDGRPVAPPLIGFARQTTELDKAGVPVAIHRFDAQGRSISLHVVVVVVIAGGQGEALGLRKGDIFQTYDGQAITDGGTFTRRRQAEALDGPSRRLTILRDGKPLTLMLRPGRLNVDLHDEPVAPPSTPPAPPARGRIGPARG